MKQVWSVRPATLGDIELLEKLFRASYATLMKSSYDAAILDAALPFITKANPVLLQSDRYYVCTQTSGNLMGCGGWSLERPGSSISEPGLGHIRHFATHPDWAGRGIGRAIYSRCQEGAKASGLREFECHASLNAEGFYLELGFRTVEQIVISPGPGLSFPALLMKKVLD